MKPTKNRLFWAVALVMALSFAGTTTPAHSQTAEEIAISGFGGLTTDPGGFDVFRQTEFDKAFHVGGTLSFRMSPHLAVRGDVSRAWSSGRESGAVSEPVDFDRTYYGVALEGRLPLDGITPYVLGGGGMVSVDRRAEMRTYQFTTLGGKVGGGLAHELSGAPVEVFVEGGGWFYDRVTTGQGLQFDTSVSGGITVLPSF